MVINIYISAALSVLLCLTAGCNRGGNTQTQLPSPERSQPEKLALVIDDKDAYAVYSALLGGPATGVVNQGSDTVAIRDHTRIGIFCSELSWTIDPRLLLAGRDLIEKNSKEWALRADGFDLSRRVKMISSAELDRIFDDGAQGWTKFHNTYPGSRGFRELSAVGFSPGKDFAVVYSAGHCGSLCGAGGFVTLSKKSGVWQKNTGRLCSWIS